MSPDVFHSVSTSATVGAIGISRSPALLFRRPELAKLVGALLDDLTREEQSLSCVERSDEEFRAKLRRQEWEVVLPELVFGDSSQRSETEVVLPGSANLS